MKYVLVIGDGMADDPLPELGGKTPLEACCKPYFDSLCRAACWAWCRLYPRASRRGATRP